MGAISGALVAGVLFGAGLMVSGMSVPANVLGFFDVIGPWNPQLAFVLGAGLTVTVIGYRLTLKRQAPLFSQRFYLPEHKPVDARLIGGAVIFGLGWGIAGYCPGPALVAAIAGGGDALIFMTAMGGGMFAWVLASRRAAVCPLCQLAGPKRERAVTPPRVDRE